MDFLKRQDSAENRGHNNAPGFAFLKFLPPRLSLWFGINRLPENHSITHIYIETNKSLDQRIKTIHTNFSSKSHSSYHECSNQSLDCCIQHWGSGGLEGSTGGVQVELCLEITPAACQDQHRIIHSDQELVLCNFCCCCQQGQ